MQDLYEEISESIDDKIIECRKKNLSPDDTRQALFGMMTIAFRFMNRAEKIEPKLIIE